MHMNLKIALENTKSAVSLTDSMLTGNSYRYGPTTVLSF